MALYHVGRFGSIPLLRFYNKRAYHDFSPRVANSRVLSRINLSSPFSVAFGRLFAMRIPLTLTLGVKRDLKTLSMGVLISSIVWDAVYIAVGLTVGSDGGGKAGLYVFLFAGRADPHLSSHFPCPALDKTFQAK